MSVQPDNAIGRHRSLQAVAMTMLVALAAAAADLSVAVAYWEPRGALAEHVLQSPATWVLGPSARQGGWATAALGMVFYAAILSLLMATYRGLSRRFRMLVRHPVPFGAVYGALMYGLIFLVAIPCLGAAPQGSFPLDWHLLCVAAYAVLIGIPGALLASFPRSSARD